MPLLIMHLLIMLLLPGTAQAVTDDDAWQALQQGRAMLLMRHANAPGIGDPPGFVLDRCNTQRNLDACGRAQAEAWGERLRQHGITQARVYSSQFCRSLDTARLLNVGEVIPAPELNSFFPDEADALNKSGHCAGLWLILSPACRWYWSVIRSISPPSPTVFRLREKHLFWHCHWKSESG
ncbi:histidine phosphatase family protein [Oceanimonas sp. NS1]|nr:histidine phosphatase family protein [Oceanimonas sp. NS1]